MLTSDVHRLRIKSERDVQRNTSYYISCNHLVKFVFGPTPGKICNILEFETSHPRKNGREI